MPVREMQKLKQFKMIGKTRIIENVKEMRTVMKSGKVLSI